MVRAGRAGRARPLRGARRGLDDLEGRVVRRGRVGEGRVGSDRAALRRGARGEPGGRRRAGDRERGSVRRRAGSSASALERAVRGRLAARRRGVHAGPRETRELPLAHRRRPRGDARGDRRRVRRRALPRHPGRRALRPASSTSSRRSARLELQRHLEELAARNVDTTKELSFLGAGDLRPLRAGDRRRGPPARRVPHRVHAVSARDEPGHPAGDLRVPDRDLRAHGDGRLERLRLRRHDRRRGRVPHRASTRRAARRSSSPRRRTRRYARS